MAHETAREAALAFADAVASARRAAAAPKTGQQVPFHGDFARVGPSTLRELEWWSKRILDATEEVPRG